jgi:YgiT-type zinc finger domain-containing protein
MRRSWIEQIRESIRLGQFDMTAHAMEEMAEDDLDIADVQQAFLNGRVAEIQRGDPRGTKYVVKGRAASGSALVGVSGSVRFKGPRLNYYGVQDYGVLASTMYGYRCEYCDGTVKPRLVEREAFKHKNGFIILERVNIGVCDTCGNRYYSAEIVQAVDELASGKRVPERTEKVPVAHVA